MPAATNKSDLIAVTEKEYGKLIGVIDPISEDVAMRKDGDTSIKDTIAHRAHWITLFLGWYHDGLAGKTVHFPAEGYKWNELPRYNAALREQQSGLGWDDARALLATNKAKLSAFLDEQDDATLYGGPMKGANNKWTPGRWAEAAGASHFRSAAKYIRQTLRHFS